MVRISVLFLVAIITLTGLFLYYNPDFVEETWLWIVGLLGPAVAYMKAFYKIIKRFIFKIHPYVSKK